jgi:hypothetical protein
MTKKLQNKASDSLALTNVNAISFQPESISVIFPNLGKKEALIYDAHNHLKQFKDYTENEEINKITEAVGVLAMYVGYGKNVEEKQLEQELIMMNLFIRNSFGKFNIEDLKFAIEKFGRIEFKLQYKGSFSPVFIGTLLVEYRPFKTNLLHNIKQKIEKHNRVNQLLPVPKAEEGYKFWKEHMLIAKEKSKTFSYIDNEDLIYNFLVNNKLLKFTKKMIEEAEKWANRKLVNDTKKKRGRGFTKKVTISAIRNEPSLIKYKRQYAINDWLRSMKITEFKQFLQNYKPKKK